MTRASRGVRPKARRFRIPRGALGLTSAPFTEVLQLGGRRWGPRLAGLVLPALVVGGLLALLASPPVVRAQPPRPKLVTASLLRPPPPPEPPKEEPPPPPRKKVEPPKGDTSEDPAPDPIPEESAQAGQVVAQAEDPSEELSPEEFSMAVGAGLSYVGGLTASMGKSDKAVEGGGGGTGKGFGSKAREAWPVRTDWSCDWPANSEDVIRVATMRIRINAQGKAEHVEVLKAPTPEIADVVQRCAMKEKYHPARDALGNNITTTTRPLTIRFLKQ
ncbi:MAG: hypothetical protein L0Y64_21830 [Myxococcaceae bacterium]|nr:hypothetical protein [Myxococcaceae bacterium]